MLSKTMKRFCEFTEGINRGVSWLVVIMLVLLVGIVSVSVFYRYALNDSIAWSSEAARYLCIWIGFLAASVAMRRQMHIGLTILIDRLGYKERRVIGILSHAAVFVFLVFVSWLGFRLAARQMMQTSPALMLPMGLAYLSIPVSAVLMGIQSLSLMIIMLFKIQENQRGCDLC